LYNDAAYKLRVKYTEKGTALKAEDAPRQERLEANRTAAMTTAVEALNAAANNSGHLIPLYQQLGDQWMKRENATGRLKIDEDVLDTLGVRNGMLVQQLYQVCELREQMHDQEKKLLAVEVRAGLTPAGGANLTSAGGNLTGGALQEEVTTDYDLLNSLYEERLMPLAPVLPALLAAVKQSQDDVSAGAALSRKAWDFVAREGARYEDTAEAELAKELDDMANASAQRILAAEIRGVQRTKDAVTAPLELKEEIDDETRAKRYEALNQSMALRTEIAKLNLKQMDNQALVNSARGSIMTATKSKRAMMVHAYKEANRMLRDEQALASEAAAVTAQPLAAHAQAERNALRLAVRSNFSVTQLQAKEMVLGLRNVSANLSTVPEANNVSAEVRLLTRMAGDRVRESDKLSASVRKADYELDPKRELEQKERRSQMHAQDAYRSAIKEMQEVGFGAQMQMDKWGADDAFRHWKRAIEEALETSRDKTNAA
jgi:hypothetical protein